jgi:hypothetical protein
MKRKILLVLITTLFFSTFIFGQIKIHKSYTSDDGLIIGEITDLLKDSEGFVYFISEVDLSEIARNENQNIM